MRNIILSAYSQEASQEVLYPPKIWNEPEIEALTMEELIRSNRELEQFAFTACHDLQEPLKVVSLYLQILKRKYQGKLEDKVEEDISSILDRTDRLQNLIQSMLNYARVGKGSVSFIELDSARVLNRAIENLRVTIEENLAQITFETCPIILGDEIQLTQLFQNLINNAIKFHKKGELPCVHISARQQETQWLFSIQDNGIGIKQEYLQSIFEIFRRLHSQSEYAGSGIGLSLCKRIVESHRGHIWAESEIEKGTTIYFTIPKI